MPDAPAKPKRRRRRRRKPSTNGQAKNKQAEFGYDGAETSRKRASPSPRLKGTDQILTPTKRKQLTASARDLAQNFSLAAWAIRRHLDYVARFTFQPQTGDKALDSDIAALMDWYGRPLNCDVTGRHNLARMIRLAEERRTVDGDVFLVKLSSGHLQAIESDRVRDPGTTNKPGENFVHGIKTTKSGRPVSYAIHRRTDSGGYEWERNIKAGSVYHLGYFDRYDQLRGVSPLAPALNSFRDLAESYNFALNKAKISQYFGLCFFRDSVEGWGDVSEGEDTGYTVDMGKGGGIVLDLDPGDKVEFLESKSPHNEFQAFTEQMTALALKSLDIPRSFADEAATNFFGSRSAFIHYEKSAKIKRQALTELLDRITAWRLSLFIADGDLALPAGMLLRDVRWSWVPDGTPWWNPQQEINADITAINAGLKTRSQVVRERLGLDFKDVVDRLAEEEAYMQERGISEGQ